MVPPPPLHSEETRRERRIRHQREAIVEAAAELFAQKGYEATTTKDIGRAVDVGESTLYGYFSSKQEILQVILSQQVEMVDSLLMHLGELKNRQSFVDLVDLLMEKILSRNIHNRVLIGEAWINDEILRTFVFARWKPLMDTLENFISSCIAAGIFRPIEPALGARMIIAIFISAILPAVRGVEPLPSPEQRRQLASMMVELIFNGFGVQKG